MIVLGVDLKSLNLIKMSYFIACNAYSYANSKHTKNRYHRKNSHFTNPFIVFKILIERISKAIKTILKAMITNITQIFEIKELTL